MPLAGELCKSHTFGWESLYYILGGVSLFLFVIFYFFFRDSPKNQKQ
jgi:predicted MFS family arabinose efflux permease